ncbi:hypothetical protein BH23PLA1_BH23PLA1_11520 [soil metagenome]
MSRTRTCLGTLVSRLWLIAAVSGLPMAATVAWALPEQEEITLEIVKDRGWENNLRLRNGEVELIVTLDVGPRILSYRRLDGENVLKEYPEQLGQSGEPEWMIRGGHRLWVSPEDPGRTYAPDNARVAHEVLGPGHVRLTPAPDRQYGLQKEIELKLDTSGTGVEIRHRVRNIGAEPTELAIWALTVLKPGGVEIIPLPPQAPHPGGPETATVEKYAPAQSFTTWPYTDFQDPRWTFGSQAILLRQDPNRGPTKLGMLHRTGAVGYLNEGNLFLKRFSYLEGQTYPDFHCNYETFTNEDMLELETLGPLVKLAPGEMTEHLERWNLIADLKAPEDDSELLDLVLPILLESS